MFTSCKEIINSSALGCLGRGLFVCGDNMAYPFLPVNWTGSCAPALLLPDIEIIRGDEPIPLTSFDMFIPRWKRAVQFIPLLVGLGISSTLATGSAGVGVAISTYNKLSQQFIEDVNMVYQSVRGLQDQVDSLAEVVLQNRRGLDLLTSNKGGYLLSPIGEVLLLYQQVWNCSRSNSQTSRGLGKKAPGAFRQSHVECLEWNSALPSSPPWALGGVLIACLFRPLHV